MCVDSPAHSSIGTPLRNKSSSTLCKCVVSVLFHCPSGLIFTFPSRYWFTIDLYTYVALPVSPGRFIQAIHVSDYSRTVTKESTSFQVRGYYPLGLLFPEYSSIKYFCNSSCINATSPPYNPYSIAQVGLGFSLFARRYSGNAETTLTLCSLRCRA